MSAPHQILYELRQILHELGMVHGHLVNEDKGRDHDVGTDARRDNNITHISHIILKVSEVSEAYVECLKQLGLRNLTNEIRKIRIDKDLEDNNAKTDSDVGMRDVPSPVRQEGGSREL